MEKYNKQSNTLVFDILHSPNGQIGEVDSYDFMAYATERMHKFLLANSIDLSTLKVEFVYKFESTHISFGSKRISIFQKLHDFAKQFNLRNNQITFINGNFKLWKFYDNWKSLACPQEKSINLMCYFQMMTFYNNNMMNEGQQDVYVDVTEGTEIVKDRPMQYVYNCLNRVARSHRMSLYFALAKNNLLEHGLVSFNEKLPVQLPGDTFNEKLYNRLPIYLDYPKDQFQQPNDWILGVVNMHQYENVHDLNSGFKFKNHFMDIINNSFVTVVPETEYGIPQHLTYDFDVDNSAYLAYQNGFITEKTFRHIRDGHPMLWVSAPYTIDMLRYMGFQTFARWWDESYDTILDPLQRLNAVIDVLKRLCTLTADQRRQMFNEMIPTLEHNQRVLQSFKTQVCYNRENWLEYSKNWKFSDFPIF